MKQVTEQEVSSINKPLRDNKGRLLPGESANLQGRPKKTHIEKVIERTTKDTVLKYIQDNSLQAAERVEDLSRNASEKVKLAANKDILDRAGVTLKEESSEPTNTVYIKELSVKINKFLP